MQRDMNVTVFRSLRTRILGIVIGLLVIVSTAITVYTLDEYEEVSKAGIRHEGMLLSNVLEAGIAGYAHRNDVASIQAFIDQVVAARAENDIEINVIFPVGATSAIVASNDRGNIEATDRGEHRGMLQALAARRAVIRIGVTSDDIDPDDIVSSRTDPTHIDYYIKPGQRYMSISTPLIVDGRELGCINIQLSLGALDDIRRELYLRILTTLGLVLLVVATGIGTYLNARVFRPLWMLAESIYRFGVGDLAGQPAASARPDEIGVIDREFAAMVSRIRKAEADNRTYLQEIEHQKNEVEKLLLNILPRDVIARLQAGANRIADAHPAATVLFADLVGFTQFATGHSAEKVVEVLDEVFSRFDRLAIEHGVEKIKTIGDSYMGVCGVPAACPDHVERAARMALGMVEEIRAMNAQGICDFRIRIGLHCGAAVAGVIGQHKFSYDVWGDTVNIAKRFESASEANRIHLSAAVAAAIATAFEVVSRGRIAIKDLGTVETFFLVGPRAR